MRTSVFPYGPNTKPIPGSHLLRSRKNRIPEPRPELSIQVTGCPKSQIGVNLQEEGGFSGSQESELRDSPWGISPEPFFREWFSRNKFSTLLLPFRPTNRMESGAAKNLVGYGTRKQGNLPLSCPGVILFAGHPVCQIALVTLGQPHWGPEGKGKECCRRSSRPELARSGTLSMA